MGENFLFKEKSDKGRGESRLRENGKKTFLDISGRGGGGKINGEKKTTPFSGSLKSYLPLESSYGRKGRGIRARGGVGGHRGSIRGHPRRTAYGSV